MTDSAVVRPAAPVRIAAVQTVSGPDVAANLRAVEALVAEAAAAGASLVALPEYFALISADERAKVAIRERDGAGLLQDFLRACAARHGVWLIGGTVPLVAEADDKVRNTTLVYDARGERVARYDKIHLFGFQRGAERYDEAATIEAGAQVCAFDSPAGRTGLSVCYDLRFPELFRALGDTDHRRDVAEAHVRVPVEADQHVRVVRKKGPALGLRRGCLAGAALRAGSG